MTLTTDLRHISIFDALGDNLGQPVADVLKAFGVCEFTDPISLLSRETERHNTAFAFSGSTSSVRRHSHFTHCPLNFQHPQG